MLMNSGEYLDLVQSIKQEIQSAQYRAALNVNRELICLYYDIGSAMPLQSGRRLYQLGD